MIKRSLVLATLCAGVISLAGIVGTGSALAAAQPRTVTGVVFADKNSSGRPDGGEGLSGAKLQFSAFTGSKSYRVVTGKGGRFRLALPAGTYYLDGAARPWVVIPRAVTVTAKGAALTLRAVRPLGKVLKVRVALGKHRYAPGDTAHIAVTMSNIGSTTLRGITPACDRVGDPDELNNSGRNWGSLTNQGPGALLPAHHTRTFHISARVPAAAQRSGVVAVACDFGYPGVESGYRPTSGDRARVPGQSGALDGTVYLDPDTSHGLKNVRVELVDPQVCPVVVRTAKTDAKGYFRIGGVPASPTYRLYVYPTDGYKVVGGNPTNADVFGNDTTQFYISVRRGTAKVPAPPTRCS